jgi:hypothetical protein
MQIDSDALEELVRPGCGHRLFPAEIIIVSQTAAEALLGRSDILRAIVFERWGITD